MKYKVGNIVKVINDVDSYFDKGDIVQIVEIDDSLVPYRCLRLKDNKSQWLDEEDFELVRYTWEDFKKAPTGTKVTFESGLHIFKIDKDEFGDEFANMSDNFSYEDLENFKTKVSGYGKIIKIEEPIYTTVYEPEVKEMTIAELEKELGYKIKIVKEK